MIKDDEPASARGGIVPAPAPTGPQIQPLNAAPTGTQPAVAPATHVDYSSQAAPASHVDYSQLKQGGSPANVMESLLKGSGVGVSQPGMQPSGPGYHFSMHTLSQDSMAVVSGLINAFMHHIAMAPAEKKCLENNVGQFTGDVMGTVADVVTAVKALIEGKGTISKDKSGGVVSAGLDSAMKITSLVATSTQLFKNCVHGDALLLLNTTAKHLINGTYLEHNFVVNGVDIGHALADSVIAFEYHHFHQFGHDLGLTLRKILLSNATNGSAGLPEGVPEQEIIQKCTSGLMKGFFVEGSAVKITDTQAPDVDIEIDLHQCIAGNQAFFKEIWLAMWDLIAKLSTNGFSQGLASMTNGTSQPKWAGELMIAMMQFPMALNKCGLAADTQNMLMDAIQSLNAVKVQFRFPDDRFRADDATTKMAQAVEAWTNFQFQEFGYELGKLLRELVLLAFPEKYSVDSAGKLRRYSQTHDLNANQASFMSTTGIIGGGAVTLLLAFAVVRTHRRSLPRSNADNSMTQLADSLTDVEDGETGLMVE